MTKTITVFKGDGIGPEITVGSGAFGIRNVDGR